MILPIHQLVRARMAETVGRLYSIAGRRSGARRDPGRSAAAPRARRPRRAARLRRWPAGCARRRAPSPRRSPPRSAPIDGIARIEAAPNGYVNFFLDRPAVRAREWLRGRRGRRRPPATARPSSSTRRSIRTRRRTSATCATPRSATRSAGCSASSGATVEIQNYIDDTGVQVADVAVGFRELEHKTLDEVRAHRRRRRGSTTTAGISTPGSPSGTRTDKDAAEDPHRRAARHRARRQRHRRHGRASSPTASSARHLEDDAAG